ncbi:uncharacterized protein LOC121738291 [Aricia agestis]|uniref:uncharacterized protein LOC121738291 n=1 Tax=Aricia agestis TaxID=91739 RepID=UPI001C20326B|nr:uncharacterized protein LOC121738291 [Aricia agestis]
MTMYGAPIWGDNLLPKNRLVLGRIQRVMATRAVRGYRTISKDAACLLAGATPWDLDAKALADERLQEPQVSVNLVLAIRPVLRDWISRETGALSFRLTQVLTGHGCFGRYLCEIVGREETPSCHHCDADRDTAEHTLTACPSWSGQRTALRAVIGNDISLPALIRSMLCGEEEWRAVEHFAEEVMTAKEEAERTREREALDSRRRPRRRRRAHNGDNLPP